LVALAEDIFRSYTVSNGTNFGVGPNVFQDLTTGTQNTEPLEEPMGLQLGVEM